MSSVRPSTSPESRAERSDPAGDAARALAASRRPASFPRAEPGQTADPPPRWRAHRASRRGDWPPRRRRRPLGSASGSTLDDRRLAPPPPERPASPKDRGPTRPAHLRDRPEPRAVSQPVAEPWRQPGKKRGTGARSGASGARYGVFARHFRVPAKRNGVRRQTSPGSPERSDRQDCPVDRRTRAGPRTRVLRIPTDPLGLRRLALTHGLGPCFRWHG